MVQFNATCAAVRWLAAATALGLMLPYAALAQGESPQSAPARGGMLDCLPLGQPLPKIPEIATRKTSGVAGAANVLRGSILLANEKQRIVFRQPPGGTPGRPGLYYVCQQQTVRVFRGLNAQPPMPLVPQDRVGDPMPGPTLRARLGDIVQLTFVNNVNPGQYFGSFDEGEKKTGIGCDTSTAGYPANAKDTFPDCFHGSSTANIHFHGTHTNPNSTGDNVFLEVRPSLRTRDQANKPIIRGPVVKPMFDEYFKLCEAELPANNPLRQWPYTWSDLPKSYTDLQEKMLKEYDTTHGRKLWPVDEKQRAKGLWPQYYIGAYPYCYRIPQYNSATWPPEAPAASHAAHTAGAGSAEASAPSHPLQMGQSPGTHWYHAHKHGSTAIDVANGMTGAFIIEGQYDDDLNTFYGTGWTQKQPVMVIQQIGVSPNLERGGGGKGQGPDKGPNFSVNGRFTPIITMAPNEVQLWRIVNASGRAATHLVGPPTGFHWRQLAQDGVQFNDTTYQSASFHDQPITLFAGNRA